MRIPTITVGDGIFGCRVKGIDAFFCHCPVSKNYVTKMQVSALEFGVGSQVRAKKGVNNRVRAKKGWLLTCQPLHRKIFGIRKGGCHVRWSVAQEASSLRFYWGIVSETAEEAKPATNERPRRFGMPEAATCAVNFHTQIAVK
jgi:hypothetical protein